VIIQYQKMAEKIKINLSNDPKKSSDEQFFFGGGAEMDRQLIWKWYELVHISKWIDKVKQQEIVRQLTGNGSTLFFCSLEMDRHIFLIITG
jgi:hypothetical protein